VKIYDPTGKQNVEAPVVRLIRTIIAIVVMSAIFGSTPLSCEEIAERQPSAAIGQVDSNADADDLAAS
jgi:hypothetical protein